MHHMLKEPAVRAAVEALARRLDALTQLCIQIQQIPAPTGQEEGRAIWIEARLRALGLADVSRDELHNVLARVPGRAARPALLVSAHTDTVFAMDTDLTVHPDLQAGRLYGPGIGDNSAGVAALLALAQELAALPPPPVDIWLAANSSEEGLGDLRGMRAVVDRLQDRLGACLVLEGMGLGRIVHRALGSRRFRIRVTAPGGHSWSDFGAASAVHVLAHIAADLTRMRVPIAPRTTFNIGRMAGGTSVNTIAQHAALELDIRSEATVALEATVEQALEIVRRYQTPRWQRRQVQVAVETIGDRPTGEIPAEHPLVVAATQALRQTGHGGRVDLRMSSTDANIPLSRGIPAICVGVTEGGNAHRLEEWIDPALLPRGMQYLLTLTWWAAGWLGGEGTSPG